MLDAAHRVKSGTMDVNARLVTPRRFAGTVRTSEGEPFASGWVIAHHKSVGWSSRAQTDENGAFEIRVVPPGTLRVLVLKPDRNGGSWSVGEFRADDRAADIRLP